MLNSWRIFWKSSEIHLVEVYLIKIIFFMVFSEEGEDPVVSNQSNLDLINVKYKSKLTKLTSCIFFISDQDTGSIYFL